MQILDEFMGVTIRKINALHSNSSQIQIQILEGIAAPGIHSGARDASPAGRSLGPGLCSPPPPHRSKGGGLGQPSPSKRLQSPRPQLIAPLPGGLLDPVQCGGLGDLLMGRSLRLGGVL